MLTVRSSEKSFQIDPGAQTALELSRTITATLKQERAKTPRKAAPLNDLLASAIERSDARAISRLATRIKRTQK